MRVDACMRMLMHACTLVCHIFPPDDSPQSGSLLGAHVVCPLTTTADCTGFSPAGSWESGSRQEAADEKQRLEGERFRRIFRTWVVVFSFIFSSSLKKCVPQR